MISADKLTVEDVLNCRNIADLSIWAEDLENADENTFQGCLRRLIVTKINLLQEEKLAWGIVFRDVARRMISAPVFSNIERMANEEMVKRGHRV